MQYRGEEGEDIDDSEVEVQLQLAGRIGRTTPRGVTTSSSSAIGKNKVDGSDNNNCDGDGDNQQVAGNNTFLIFLK